MQDTRYGTKARRAAVAVVSAATVALLATACGPGNDEPSGAGASAAPTVAATASAAPSAKSPAPTEAGTPSTGAATVAAPSGGPTSSGTAVPTCAPTALKVDAHQAKVRPEGTGLGAAIVAFTNASTRPCTLQGFPTVAGAANGSPDRNAPLAVTHTGSAAPVHLAPGGKAWVKLTFVQVQGEADGYCVSGATPVAYPTLVLGLPGGAGAHQVALDDGLFAECDNKVTTTALLATSPS
ncbi:uncharacterized protein DUF4232 [Streptomyces sp. 1114.5]|uniref:DUF4232 domain-containing protein n=1 Tax=unclassified Streptomyces TaxID=2593676 RepID=UPI000BDC3576|nr:MULTISPECIES: DUF4232 domain-containing protein [unclassified Streptomyces]RKT11670.1 uncharacterized protein DUF4232 [Streptomyces sp. 1114.5]SOB80747.1 Protein of unknown function [Streptomyces sp. 1331.2]